MFKFALLEKADKFRDALIEEARDMELRRKNAYLALNHDQPLLQDAEELKERVASRQALWHKQAFERQVAYQKAVIVVVQYAVQEMSKSPQIQYSDCHTEEAQSRLWDEQLTRAAGVLKVFSFKYELKATGTSGMEFQVLARN